MHSKATDIHDERRTIVGKQNVLWMTGLRIAADAINSFGCDCY